MRGQLSSAVVADLLATVEASSQSAEVHIHSETGPGTIWLQAGCVVDAGMGALEGEPALIALLALDTGTFEVKHCAVHRQLIIRSSVNALLVQAARRRRLWAELVDRTPGLTAVLSLDRAVQAELGWAVEKEELEIIELTDGKRSMRDIIAGAGRDPLDVLTRLVTLFEAGVFRIESSSAGPEPATSGIATPGAPGTPSSRVDPALEQPRSGPSRTSPVWEMVVEPVSDPVAEPFLLQNGLRDPLRATLKGSVPSPAPFETHAAPSSTVLGWGLKRASTLIGHPAPHPAAPPDRTDPQSSVGTEPGTARIGDPVVVTAGEASAEWVPIGSERLAVQQTSLVRLDPPPHGFGLASTERSRALTVARGGSGTAVLRTLVATIDLLQGTDAVDQRVESRPEGESAPDTRGVLVTATEALPPPQRALLAGIDAPQSKRAESFRLVRHRLRASADPRVLAVAAPGVGNEAALCAAELGLAYAESGPEPVLLVEIDTERPQLAKSLGFKVEHCFSLQLCDKYDGSQEPWHALSLFHSNLHILAINPSVSSADRLSLPAFSLAMSELSRLDYGHVLIVCPRVLDSSEVALLEGVVDGVLLTGRAGLTKSGDLRRAAEQLLPNKTLGVVLMHPP